MWWDGKCQRPACSAIFMRRRVPRLLCRYRSTRRIAMFRLVLAEARSPIQQRNIIEAHAHELLREWPDYLRLRQVPGIGPIHALTILAEAGGLSRVRASRQFLKFRG